jgi:hypothetical protein
MALTKYKYVRDDGVTGIIRLDPSKFPAGVTATNLGLVPSDADDKFPIKWRGTTRGVDIHARLVRIRVKSTSARYTYPIGTATAFSAFDPGAANEVTYKRGEVSNL